MGGFINKSDTEFFRFSRMRIPRGLEILFGSQSLWEGNGGIPLPEESTGFQDGEDFLPIALGGFDR